MVTLNALTAGSSSDRSGPSPGPIWPASSAFFGGNDASAVAAATLVLRKLTLIVGSGSGAGSSSPATQRSHVSRSQDGGRTVSIKLDAMGWVVDLQSRS